MSNNNKIQHNTTMQHAETKDNDYPLWTSQAKISKNILKSYLERNVTQDASIQKRPQCFKVQNANQLTE